MKRGTLLLDQNKKLMSARDVLVVAVTFKRNQIKLISLCYCCTNSTDTGLGKMIHLRQI